MNRDIDTLGFDLTDKVPSFFFLTNTRALTSEDAATLTKEVCNNLKLAVEAEGVEDFLVVTRFNSTLRENYTIEIDVITQKLDGFDDYFLVPAFVERGRVIRDSIHCLHTNSVSILVHGT
jgi:uncharacterized protein YgbK (DUF1537 family)